MAANYFTVDDFALWVIFFSISMVLSAGDLGVGQYILTYMADSGDNINLASDHFNIGLTTLTILSVPVWLLGIMLVYFAEIDIAFGALLCLLVVMRLPLISYASLLQVKNRLHEKRIIDAIPYLFLLPIIYGMQSYEFNVYIQLLSVNIMLLGGGFIHLYRCKALGAPIWKIVSFVKVKEGIIKSLPYLLNNASGIVIYGGFIGIFSFYLNSYQVAILAIYHTVILSLGYQAYEVIFRNYQLRIMEKKVFNNLALFLLATGIILMILSANFGQSIFTYLYSSYEFVRRELLIFMLFSLLEFGYLLLTLRLQMSVNSRSVLRKCSIFKLCSFCLVLILLAHLQNLTIAMISGYLIIFSVVNLVNLSITHKKYIYTQ